MRPSVEDSPILQMRNVSKSFDGVAAVKDLTLNVRKGAIHALIGPNGAGKTTVFNLFTKYHRPTSGTIIYKGRDITSLTTSEIARLGVVRSFQVSAVFGNLTALENVRVALQRFRRDSMAFWKSSSVLRELNDRARALLGLVGIEHFADHKASELPYGRKRALELATTLALSPEVLLLDEPLAGMGHEDIDRMVILLRKISDDCTILMVEHNLSVVADLSDWITVLARGQILAEGEYDTVSQNPDVLRVYLGRDDE